MTMSSMQNNRLNFAVLTVSFVLQTERASLIRKFFSSGKILLHAFLQRIVRNSGSVTRVRASTVLAGPIEVSSFLFTFDAGCAVAAMHAQILF